ncbi:NAC domain-containing protein 14-like [Gossypium raimondii]|nr:NAC domain-containing protein 14-like [Gossypium raimondii]
MNNPKLKGYGFKPSDQILIDYLRDRTLFGRDYLVQDIIVLSHDICNYDPWDLPGCDSVTPNDSERFFIYPKTYKYANSKPKVIGTPTGQVPNSDQRQPMINRATKNGKWKVSGVRVNVKSSDETKQVIGIKTRLYFKHNSCPNKTSCVLHQYELVDIDPCQDKYFLGKVIMKEFKQTNISSNNINGRISIPEVRVELGPEPLVETEVTNEYEWTQSEQTNEFITPCPVFGNENFIDDGNEVISNHQSQINKELIRSLEVPNIGIEDQNQSYQNIGIDNDPTVPDEGSNQHNIGAVAENESSMLPSNLHDHLIDFINQMEWSDLYNLCRGNDDGLFLDELSDEPPELGPQNQCGINQQVAAGAEIESTNLPPLDVTESSYSTDSVRKRSALEVERSATGVETELAQQQANRSRLKSSSCLSPVFD